MSEDKQKKIFTRNLNSYIETSGKTQLEIAKSIGVSPQTFNTWCKGIAIPRMSKVQALADYFHINKSDLIEDKKPVAPSTHPPIMDFYNQLNDAGKAEATKYTKNLTFVPDYTETSLMDAIKNAPKTQEELEAMLMNESIKHNAG